MSVALITGASSGIGAEFARQLAARRHDLILVGRRTERLDLVADEVRQRHGVESTVMTLDLSQPASLDQLEAVAVERGPLEFLINNAGFGVRGRFADARPHKHLDMLRVHAEATMRLTRAALPAMIEAGRGAIVNVSSVAGFIASPGNTMYCATKAFLNNFSESLAMELHGSGVRVQALCPGYTVTEFHDRDEFAEWDRDRVPKMLWMSASDVVGLSLKGLDRGEIVCVAGLRYKLLMVFARSSLLRGLLRPLFRRRGQRGA